MQQNGIEVSFGKWLLISIPFCVIGTFISWLVIIHILKPNDVKEIPIIVYETSTEVFSRKNIIVMFTSTIAILLLATSSFTKFIFGEIGIISLCFCSFMYGSGLLTEVSLIV